jgi:RNA polymerase sigma factor (sigma-70 family)
MRVVSHNPPAMTMTLDEQQELLLSWRPWLRKVAQRMTVRLTRSGHGDRSEDLAQEGWIALWQATKTYDGRDGVPFDYWLQRCAHDRMRVVLRLWMAKCRDVNITELGGNPWEQISNWSELSSENAWVSLLTNLGDVEFAYHHGEIAQAMACLTPRQREYVYLRYCRGYTSPELTAHFGYPPKTLGVRARECLAAKLPHLVS